MSCLVKDFKFQVSSFKFKALSLFFCTYLLVLALTTKAQTCSVVFQSIDTSLYFTSSLNQQIQNTVFVNNIRLTGLEVNNKYLAQIYFKDDTVKITHSLFLLDAGFTHYYQVDKKGIYLKKIVPSLKETPDPNQYLVVCEKFSPAIAPVILPDTNQSKVDTLAVRDHYHMEGYEGKIGCPYPIKEEEFSKLRLILLNATLEDTKLDNIKTAIQDMETPCFTIDQLKTLVQLFEYEETKLDFAKFVSSSIFDIDNVSNLSSVFDFENSIEELKQIIGM